MCTKRDFRGKNNQLAPVCCHCILPTELHQRGDGLRARRALGPPQERAFPGPGQREGPRSPLPAGHPPRALRASCEWDESECVSPLLCVEPQRKGWLRAHPAFADRESTAPRLWSRVTKPLDTHMTQMRHSSIAINQQFREAPLGPARPALALPAPQPAPQIDPTGQPWATAKAECTNLTAMPPGQPWNFPGFRRELQPLRRPGPGPWGPWSQDFGLCLSAD